MHWVPKPFVVLEPAFADLTLLHDRYLRTPYVSTDEDTEDLEGLEGLKGALYKRKDFLGVEEEGTWPQPARKAVITGASL
jgi:hypothetical protein